MAIAAASNLHVMVPAELLPPALCVLGTGLIGGSLMRAAAAASIPVHGWTAGADDREAALTDGFEMADSLEVALERAVAADALVVLATPVPTFATLLRTIGQRAPTVLLTDVGGVKAPVAAQVAALAPAARYIGSHPMCGSESSGWGASRADLFTGRTWVATIDDDGPVDHWLPVAALALAVGAQVVPCGADAHDAAAARISHLPHLLAAALAHIGAAAGPLALALAAGSFTDVTRVAATPVDTVRAMCESNPSHLIDAMDEALAQLGVARGSLASSGSLAKLIEAGHAGRAALAARADGLRPVTLRAPDLAEQLLAVGAAGGHVTGLSGSGGEPEVAAMYPDGDGDG